MRGVSDVGARLQVPTWFERALASGAVALLLSGFVVYQAAVRLELVASSLGGFGTVAAVLVTPILGVCLVLQASSWGVRVSALDCALYLYLLLLVAAAAFLPDRVAAQEIAASHLAFAFKFVVWYAAGRAFVASQAQRSSLSVAALLLACSAVLAGSASQGFLSSAFVAALPGAAPIDYQGMSMALLGLALLVLPGQGLGLRWALSVVVLVSLFALGARSEFVAALIALAVVEVLRARRPLQGVIGATVVVGLLVGGVTVSGILSVDNRILGLLELASDESARVRSELLTRAIATIIENPVLGAYASYPPGEYAHNALSAWVDLGVVGFALLLVLVWAPLVVLARSLKRDIGLPAFVQATSLCICAALMLTVAKYHTYQLLPLALGAFAGYRQARSEGRAAAEGTAA